MCNTTDLMSWLVSPEVPLGSAINLAEIFKLQFYANIPEEYRRDKIVRNTIAQLSSQGYVSKTNNHIIKCHFLE